MDDSEIKTGVSKIYTDTYEQALAEYFEKYRAFQESQKTERLEDVFWKNLETNTAIFHSLIQPKEPQPKNLQRKSNRQLMIGANLQKFLNECGWTPYQLAKKTGLSKQLVLGHVNKNKGCSQSTMKKYADAFTEGLGRSISIGNLTS